jgi:flagellar P-ring protein FlgI
MVKTMRYPKSQYKLLLALLLMLNSALVAAERIKDLAEIAGVRSNQLVGYGLVVGLNKTGDKTKFTGQSLRSMLAILGTNFPIGVDPKARNIAAVSISAELPPFAKPGQKIDVTVSSLGDAKSLRGGTLLMSPLKGADGHVYAIAQGSLVVGGLTAAGADGSSITVNNPAAGRIANGAIVERSVPTPFGDGNALVFNLYTADFTTANRMVEAINRILGPSTANAVDATSIKVSAPLDISQRVTFVSMVENMRVIPDDAPARVIINSRTGTVVINSKVRVQPAAVAHGNLVVTITENEQVSQPGAFARRGDTVTTQQSDVQVDEGSSHMFVFNPGVSLDEIVAAVNKVGAAPSDLVAILEALKTAGALRAELIII